MKSLILSISVVLICLIMVSCEKENYQPDKPEKTTNEEVTEDIKSNTIPMDTAVSVKCYEEPEQQVNPLKGIVPKLEADQVSADTDEVLR